LRQLRRPHHLARPIVDHRQPRRCGPRIELQPQRLRSCLHTDPFEDQREGGPMQHGRLAMREQPAGSARMHRTLWPPLLIYHQDKRHLTTPLPVAGPPLVGVRSSSPLFSTGFLDSSAARRFKPQLAFLTANRRVRNWKGRAASAYSIPWERLLASTLARGLVSYGACRSKPPRERVGSLTSSNQQGVNLLDQRDPVLFPDTGERGEFQHAQRLPPQFAQGAFGHSVDQLVDSGKTARVGVPGSGNDEGAGLGDWF